MKFSCPPGTIAALPVALQSTQDAVVVRHRPTAQDAAGAAEQQTQQQPATLEQLVLRGPAEVCRLLLEVTATPYDCIMYFDGGRTGETRTPWDVRKPATPLGELPVYTGPELPAGMELAESGAICRHLARVNGLAGSNVAEAAAADMTFEAARHVPGVEGGWRVEGVLLAEGGIPQGALSFEERNAGKVQVRQPY